MYPDAEADPDGGFFDANPRLDAMVDAGPPDSEVVLYDSGTPPVEFPFTGQYVVEGQSSRLFARESRGRLAVIIGSEPYVYEGTIAPNGDVDVVGNRLRRSGCSDARITGSYQRRTATLFLEATGCLLDGTPFSTSIRGGFETDYNLGFSGLYQMSGVVMNGGNGCYAGPVNVMEMLWGVNVLPDNSTLAIHVAYDIVEDAQAVYVGRLELPDYAFAAIETVFAQSSGVDVSMRGNLTRSGTDAPLLVGTRDVYDPLRGCFFSMAFQGRKFSDF